MADEAGKRVRWLSMPEKRSGYHPRVADKETEVPGSKWLGGDHTAGRAGSDWELYGLMAGDPAPQEPEGCAGPQAWCCRMQCGSTMGVPRGS